MAIPVSAAPVHNPAPIRVLALLPQFIPSTILTVVKPLVWLHRAGRITADITLESRGSARQVERADVVVFSRNAEPEYGQWLNVARTLGKSVIYDIDDNLFELPTFYPRERRYLNAERLQQLERYLRAAEAVRVYSQPMLERALQYNPRVGRVDGPIDWSLVPTSPPRRDPRRVRIVYATSRFDDELARLFLADLQRILDAYADRVAVCFWGFDPPELRGHPGVEFRSFVPSYDRFFHQFVRAGFDIGLAPLPDDVFHRSKSNNKFREYAAARIAGVYSNVDVYASCVEHDRTGLLVSPEPGAWYAALSRLIEDPHLRTKIQQQAFAIARTRYGVEQMSAVWLEQIQSVLRDHPHVDSVGESAVAHAEHSPASTVVGAVRRAIYLLGAMRRHGRAATIKRIRRDAKDWRLLLWVKWQLNRPNVWPFG
ncbi:MAG TPA: glycosyltransferase [Candidatus Binatia bacterium]|nr:glycosyltransferase [Candidatus Binatia bacterium]